MKFGVSSYSYRQAVNAGTLGFLDLPAKAKEMGFDVIEFSTFMKPDDVSTADYAVQVREACDNAGIAVANYTIWADFLNGSDGNLEAEIERVKDEVRVAEILGAPGMRHDATGGFTPAYKGPRGFDDALPVLAQGCRAVTEFAADKGIKTMVENHGFFCQDSVRVEKLMNAVNHENFGALLDMGNFLCADENPAEAFGRLMPHAVHCHAKDFHVKSGMAPDPGEGWFQSRAGNYLRGAIIGHGDVPIPQCIRLMKKGGYDGVLSIEFEGMEEPLKAMQIGLDNLKRFAQM